MNWAASYLANRKGLKEWYKMEDFLRQKWEEKKSGLFHTRSSVFVEGPGSVMQVTSHVLIRKFQIPWLKVPFLGEVETVVKSWFAVLVESDSILDLLFLFSQKVKGLDTFHGFLPQNVMRINKIMFLSTFFHLCQTEDIMFIQNNFNFVKL